MHSLGTCKQLIVCGETVVQMVLKVKEYALFQSWQCLSHGPKFWKIESRLWCMHSPRISKQLIVCGQTVVQMNLKVKECDLFQPWQCLSDGPKFWQVESWLW